MQRVSFIFYALKSLLFEFRLQHSSALDVPSPSSGYSSWASSPSDPDTCETLWSSSSCNASSWESTSSAPALPPANEPKKRLIIRHLSWSRPFSSSAMAIFKKFIGASPRHNRRATTTLNGHMDANAAMLSDLWYDFLQHVYFLFSISPPRQLNRSMMRTLIFCEQGNRLLFDNETVVAISDRLVQEPHKISPCKNFQVCLFILMSTFSSYLTEATCRRSLRWCLARRRLRWKRARWKYIYYGEALVDPRNAFLDTQVL